MRPILFQFGDFRFYSFGLMAALALIVPGMTIVRALVRRRGVPGEFAYELIIAAGVGGFVFARIYYLIENYAAVKADFWGAAFGGAGFVWYGGLIGGFLGVVGWTLVRRYSLDIIANAMAPATAFGYLIGRIGCQLAGDGDYGKPSNLPWAMGYPDGTVPTPPGVTVHPTPIYEIIAMAFVVWILWRLATRYDKSGWWTFGWFLVLSGIERFLVEFVRINPDWFAGLTQPQWVSIVSVVIGVALIFAFGKKPAVVVGGAGRAEQSGDATSRQGVLTARPATADELRRPGAGRWARGGAGTAPCSISDLITAPCPLSKLPFHERTMSSAPFFSASSAMTTAGSPTRTATRWRPPSGHVEKRMVNSSCQALHS